MVLGSVRPFADTVGVAVVEITALKKRLDPSHRRMSHHLVTKGRHRNRLPLRLCAVKAAVRTGLVGAPGQLVLQPQQIDLQIALKYSQSCFMAFSSPCFDEHLVEVLKRA